MQLEILQYKTNEGWNVESFPNLDSENTLIIIFSAPEFIDNPSIIKEFVKHYPKSKIVGCSSAGEILDTHILDNSISVAIAKFEKTSIDIVKTEIKSTEDSYKAGESISQQLSKKEKLRSIFVLSDGLQVNGSELVKGLNTIQNDKIVITGGLAGDGSRFKQTWGIFNGEIYKNYVIGVGFYGDHIQIGHGFFILCFIVLL